MIDKAKNHTYIITINYFVRDNEGKLINQQRTFTSNHSITSNYFRKWLDEKLNTISDFAFMDEEYGTQYTVPIEDYCK